MTSLIEAYTERADERDFEDNPRGQAALFSSKAFERKLREQIDTKLVVYRSYDRGKPQCVLTIDGLPIKVTVTFYSYGIKITPEPMVFESRGINGIEQVASDLSDTLRTCTEIAERIAPTIIAPMRCKLSWSA